MRTPCATLSPLFSPTDVDPLRREHVSAAEGVAVPLESVMHKRMPLQSVAVLAPVQAVTWQSAAVQAVHQEVGAVVCAWMPGYCCLAAAVGLGQVAVAVGQAYSEASTLC